MVLDHVSRVYLNPFKVFKKHIDCAKIASIRSCKGSTLLLSSLLSLIVFIDSKRGYGCCYLVNLRD